MYLVALSNCWNLSWIQSSAEKNYTQSRKKSDLCQSLQASSRVTENTGSPAFLTKTWTPQLLEEVSVEGSDVQHTCETEKKKTELSYWNNLLLWTSQCCWAFPEKELQSTWKEVVSSLIRWNKTTLPVSRQNCYAMFSFLTVRLDSKYKVWGQLWLSWGAYDHTSVICSTVFIPFNFLFYFEEGGRRCYVWRTKVWRREKVLV